MAEDGRGGDEEMMSSSMTAPDRGAIFHVGVVRRAVSAAAIAAAIAGCGAPRPATPAPPATPAAPAAPTTPGLRERAAAALGTLPPAPQPTPISELGRRLFFETRAAADGAVGCVTCHLPALWATDGLARSQGAFGRPSDRNAPTLFDAAPQFVQHWRGDRASVEDQAQRSLVGKAAFGLSSPDEAARRLAEIPGLGEAFRKAFPLDPQPVSAARFGEAVGAYVRTLRAPGPFDAYLAGDDRALSAAAQRGLARFLDLGCARCHDGPRVGGTSFRRFGVLEPYPEATGSSPIDTGREAITGAAADRYVFKVPPLRHVAKTSPYFHDGSVVALGEAVRIMARVQLGKTLGPDEIADLVAFLDSLTGEPPATYAPPEGAPPVAPPVPDRSRK
jgi:cytochrome c peroxidase